MALSPAKRMILAIGFAGIAATGAIAGAQLKTEREREGKRAIIARDMQIAPGSISTAGGPATAAEREDLLIGRITALEGQRAQLLMQRHGVQKKLEAFEERKELNAKKAGRRNEAQSIMDSNR